MHDKRAEQIGVKPLARIIASTVAAIRPEIMGLGPIPAIQALLKQTGMTMDEIDIVELNEAFAAQVVPCREELGIPDEKLNPFGGAIALGHPFGMTGARIMTTLLNGLRATDGTPGIELLGVAGYACPTCVTRHRRRGRARVTCSAREDGIAGGGQARAPRRESRRG